MELEQDKAPSSGMRMSMSTHTNIHIDPVTTHIHGQAHKEWKADLIFIKRAKLDACRCHSV